MSTLAALLLAVLTLGDTVINEPPEPQAARPESGRRDSPPAAGFLLKTVEVGGAAYAYTVYVPAEYTPERAWPVVLFLHGSGERGRDGLLQTDVGIAAAIRRNRAWFPALVVMPQCEPGDVWWSDRMMGLALATVEAASREYRLDADRVYLTGLSLGGAGVWHIGAKYGKHFAALVPICGFAELGQDTGEAGRLAPMLTGLPIWCFHGALDDRVPVKKSRDMVGAIRAAGGVCYYSELAEGNHFIWDRVYGDVRLWKWLFEQRRGAAGADPTAEP